MTKTITVTCPVEKYNEVMEKVEKEATDKTSGYKERIKELLGDLEGEYGNTVEENKE